MYLLQYRNYLFIPGYTIVIGYAVNTSINFITTSYLEGALALVFPPTLVLIASSAHLSPQTKNFFKKENARHYLKADFTLLLLFKILGL